MRRLSALGVAIAAGVAVTVFVLESGGGSAASASTSPVATAPVIRTTLASRQQVSGTLARAGSYTVVVQQTSGTSQSSGTLSELPAPGTVIGRGQPLYWVDGHPVRLLYGAQAAWRDLVLGDSEGADVRQLQRNLRALGFTDYGALTVDGNFGGATAAAIDEWQRTRGVPETGFLPLGSVAFLPGPVRVTAQRAIPGTPVQPGTAVLDLTSNGLVVNVPLDPSLRQLVRVGDRVQVQLPEGQTTPGTVSQIGADTTAAAGGQSTSAASSSGTSAPGAGGGSGQATAGSSSQTSGGAPASVPVTVSLDRPSDARGLDQVPVQVSITDTVHRNVLAVPIGALVALANGGYAVAVDQGTTRTLIAVTPGVFDGNRVEVSSSQLQPGMRVEVASS
jgi:peptidoglycan hydrolase-like protein with peptidoglycan-binding domain